MCDGERSRNARSAGKRLGVLVGGLRRAASRALRPSVDAGRTLLLVEQLEDRSVPSAAFADPASGLTLPVASTTGVRRELVVVDDAVPDSAGLVAGLASNTPGVAYTVVTVHGGVGGVTSLLQQFHGLDAVHLVSHGSAGALDLGGEWLDAGDLPAYSHDLAAWGAALKPGGDLLLYGCDAAAGPGGRSFVDQLRALVGADVAASTDATGFGGNWSLEYAVGTVEAAVPFAPAATAGWRHTLGVTPLTGDITVNSNTDKGQKNADVAAFADGSFVVVWSGKGSDDKDGVFAQRYSAAGSPVGAALLVNQTTAGNQTNPSVAAGANGSFVVAWEGKGALGQDVYARTFAANGTALTGEIDLTPSLGDQKAPDVAVDGLGRVMVAWRQTGTGILDGIYARRFLSLTVPLGLTFKVSTGTGPQTSPALAADGSGGFIVAWTDGASSNSQIRVQMYDALGLLGSGFALQATPVGDADRAAVASDAAGNFVVAWQQKGASANKSDIWVQRFSPYGSPLAAAVRANTTTAEDQTDPAVAMTSDGDFVVTWTSDKQDGDGKAVIGRAYKAGGTADGGEFQANATTKEDQAVPQVAVTDAGQVVVVWQGKTAADKDGVAARLFAWAAAAAVPPTVATQSTTLTYIEDDPAALVDPALAVGGGPTLTGATVAITAGFAGAQDVLGFNATLAASLGVTGSYNAATGGLALAGAASASVYQQVLRTVTYRDASQNPSAATRTVRFTVTDGTTTATASRAVAVVPVNDAPTGADGSVTTAEDAPYTFTLADFPFTDADADTLARIKVTALPANGTLKLNGVAVIAGQGATAAQITAGQLTFTPAANANGTPYATFRFAVSDGTAFSAGDYALAVVVTPVNDAPTATADAYVVSGPTLAVAGPGVLANDGDADGNTLAAVLLSGPAYGTLTLNADGSFLYTPGGAFAGSDSFTYRAFDGTAYSAAATVTLVGPAANAPPTLTVAGPQLANEDGVLVLSTANGNGFTVSDPDGPNRTITFTVTNGTLTLTGLVGMTITGGQNGSATVTVAWTPGSDVTLNYRPDANYNGPASLTLAASDGLATTTRTTAITVLAANDPPAAADDGYTLDEGGAANVAANGVLANDADVDGDPLVASLLSGPANGSLTLNADGSFVYTPDAGFAGTDSFTYRAYDGAVHSAAATVTLTVRPTNHAPVGADDSFTIGQGGTLTAPVNGVLSNDADPDGDPLAAVLETGPANGTLTLNADGSFVYTPDAGFAGTDTFTYRPTDGTLAGTPVVVSVVVTPAPHTLAADDAYSMVAGTRLTTYGGGVLANDTDPNGDPLTAVLVSGPANGTLAFNADGTFTYRPDAGFAGTDSFVYRAVGPLGSSADAVVTITVDPFVNGWVADGETYFTREDTPLDVPAPGLLVGHPDGSTLTALRGTDPRHGTLAVNADGSFRYVPDDGFAGTDSFIANADDGSGFAGPLRIMIVVLADSARLPKGRADSYSVATNGVLAVPGGAGVLANDTSFRGSLTASLEAGPRHGTLSLNDDGSFNYVPDRGFSGTDRFTYRAADGRGTSGSVTVTLTVRAAAVTPAPVVAVVSLPLSVTVSAPTPVFAPPVAVGPVAGVPPTTGGGGYTTLSPPAPPEAPEASGTAGSFGGGGGGGGNGNAAGPAGVGDAKAAPGANAALPAEAKAGPPATPARPTTTSPPVVAAAAPVVAPVVAPITTPVSVPDAVFTSLDVLTGDVTETPKAVAYTDAAVVSVSVVSAGYVLLNTRAVYWFLSALLVRPAVWKQFDPLDVIYAWEAGKGKGKRAGRAAGDDESLQAMVGG